MCELAVEPRNALSVSVRLPFICPSLGGFLSLFTSFDTSCHTKWWIELFTPQDTHTFYLQMDRCHQACHHCITCSTLCCSIYTNTHTPTKAYSHIIDVRIFAIKWLDSILFSAGEWASFFMTFVIVEWSCCSISPKICRYACVTLRVDVWKPHFIFILLYHPNWSFICCRICRIQRWTIRNAPAFHAIALKIACDFNTLTSTFHLSSGSKYFPRICEWQMSTVMILLSIFVTRFDQSYSSY